MTSTEHTLSELLRHAARRIRNDGHFELLADAPPRPSTPVRSLTC